jgi:hypothetical protein
MNWGRGEGGGAAGQLLFNRKSWVFFNFNRRETYMEKNGKK